jgi:hypothetical protein
MDRALTFNKNIEKRCCKGLKILGLIKRVSTEFKLLAPLKALYCAFGRSTLEYGTVTWDLYTATSRNQIERVQHKFLNYAAKVLHIEHKPHNYEPVRTLLELSNLTDRRIAANKIFLQKLIDGSIDCSELLSQLNFKIPCFYSRSHYPFFIPLCTTNYIRNKPLFRMMRIANESTATPF